MASGATENTPLIREPNDPPPAPPRPQRTVTFNPTVSHSGPPEAPRPPATSSGVPRQSNDGQPVLSSLQSKIRRRHSSGMALPTARPPQPKAGAQRTTRTAEKLKLLPNPDSAETGPDEESGREVYSQFTRIKEPKARSDAERLGKDDRVKLPRVTAYCTCASYRLDEVTRFLKSRSKARGTAPKQFDECVYSPFQYSTFSSEHPESEPRRPSIINQERRFSDTALITDEHHGESRRDELGDMDTQAGLVTLDNGVEGVPNHSIEEMRRPSEPRLDTLDFDTQVHTPEVFLFDYGTVVIWGMTYKEEQRFLKDIAKFENEKLSKDDIQTENFNFYYTREYQARIYNDFISLREKRHYMTKLAISHALSQSVKTSLYEDLVDNTIDSTKEIPTQIATTGKVNLSRKEINMQIGELFILRINIHLQGSVLDAPEVMWAEPTLDPIYQAVRSYLEMDQRVGLLTERLDVIADLLAVLKDQLSHTHGEYLEWIVIILIAAEIVVAAANIVVDVLAGGD